MKLDVKNLIHAPFGQKESFNIELFKEEIDEGILAERTKGELTLTRLDSEILASFKGVSKLKLICDRCVQDFVYNLPLDFSEEYQIDRNGADIDEEKQVIEAGDTIDVAEPIRQEIIVRVPIKKLCENACKGLCASCGENLNVKRCKCKRN